MADAQDRIRYVTDELLNQPPYCGVGVIQWISTNALQGPAKDETLLYRATAFYIGHGKIITAAHFFRNVVRDTAEFIPARRNEEDEYGELYGKYRVVEPIIYRGFLQDEAVRNDICCATINHGHRRIIRDGNEFFEPADINDLIPLPVGEYQRSNSREWMVLGYGGNCRMQEIRGLQLNQGRVQEEQIIEIDSQLPRGASGGPWIRTEDFARPLATGITINGNGSSRSLYLSNEILANIQDV